MEEQSGSDRRHMTVEAVIIVVWPQAMECWQPLEDGEDMGLEVFFGTSLRPASLYTYPRLLSSRTIRYCVHAVVSSV